MNSLIPRGRQQAPLKIDYVSIDDLKPNPRNAREHTEQQVNQVVESLIAFGINFPILIAWDGTVIAGHARLLAFKKRGMREVPVIRLDHLTKEQAEAFAIADNRLAELSTWDNKLLGEIFADLSALDLDFSLEATGFALDEIELKIEGLSEGDGFDPADQMPAMAGGAGISQLGDLWQLNSHRVLCGDAIDAADVRRLMDGKQATMTFADAPYGVNYADTAKDKMRGVHRPILNDDLGDQFGAFLEAACKNILAVTEGAIYMAMASSALILLQDAFAGAGGHFSTFIIWAKQTFTLGRSDYQRQYEPILYGWRDGAKRHWCGARDQSDVWFFDKPAKNDLHPTQKPVQLVMRAIRNSSERGGIVLDAFLGSGTTLIAAERTGRICYGMELDPRYVDTIIRRWQLHTGDRAVHAGTGKCFDELAAEAEASHG